MYMADLASQGLFNMWLQNSHLKIILLHTGNNWTSCEGSGNLTSNSRVEQYCVTRCQDLYAFFAKHIRHTDTGARKLGK